VPPGTWTVSGVGEDLRKPPTDASPSAGIEFTAVQKMVSRRSPSAITTLRWKRPDRPSLQKCRRAAELANETCDRAIKLPHKLSLELRAVEDRINQLEAEVQLFRDRAARAYFHPWMWRIKSRDHFYRVRSRPVMHLQIVEVDARLTGRYVANAPQSSTMRVRPTEARGAAWN
jgi:hypothetical protein